MTHTKKSIMKIHDLKPMNTIDIRFNLQAALKLVRKDLRKMRQTDRVMYYSLLGASIFLLLDAMTIGYILYIIHKTS